MDAVRTENVGEWTAVCRIEQLEPERGVTALVAGQAVAVVRTYDDAVYALGNYDPVAHASVLARGIVGTRRGVPFIASPMHKQPFNLRTGRCLDDDAVRVPTYAVRVDEGVVWVGPRTEPDVVSDGTDASPGQGAG